MPASLESASISVWQLLALAALVVATVAGSVYLARKHLASDPGLPDAAFWDGFAGLAVVVPAVVVPSLVAPWAGLMLGLLALGTAGAAYRWAPRLFSWQNARRSALETRASNAAAAERHRSALARWQRYELDPEYCFDYPAMSDPARPETAALLRAMKAAEQQRGSTGAGYSAAVDWLERALAEAERAAGATAYSSPEIPPGTGYLPAEGAR
jgi:hypothetical protein